LKICFQTRTQDVLRHRDVLLRHLDVIYQIHMGVESFAQSQLDRWSKRVKVQVNLEAMRLLAGLGICYYPYLILSDERTTVEEIAANCGGILELPPRPFSVRMGGQERSAVMHPLHSGLHLNRLKDLHGRVVRAAATRYLEAVWDFIGGTYEEAARLSDLYVYSLLGPQRAAGGAPVPKPFESGAALLEERVSRIAEIADTAATLSVAAARKAARAAAEAFRRVATRTRVDYMSGALWAPSRAVTSASDPTLRQRPRVDRPWGPSGLPAAAAPAVANGGRGRIAAERRS
ncbi:MAG: hypothetical protein HY704_07675, partial [Gemmatimonadetes bacterium]|nr:hypothetical protein [Gemmatimonadota bacterium]